MKVETINFTDIQTDVCEDLLNLEFDYDQNREVRNSMFIRYREQKRLSDQMFSEWLAQTNAELIQDIDEFVKHSLGIDGKKNLFQENYSDLIHPATVILGMQTTDHIPTLDMIEQHVNNEHPTVKTIRVDSRLSKKSQIIEILHAVQLETSSNVLVIIEQTETVNKSILESLVSGLYELLTTSTHRCIMILFCMSGSWKSINHLFPISIMNRMRRTITFVKNTDFARKDIEIKLLRNENLIFKLDPTLARLLFDAYSERDASVISMKYLYQYALFSYHTDKVSLLTMPKKDLIHLLKISPNLFSELVALALPSESGKFDGKNGLKEFAKYCREQTKYIQDYHQFIIDQLMYFLILLQDETGENFPTEISDIYRELFMNDDLGYSSKFVTAINELNKYSIDGLNKRLNQIFEIRSTKPSTDIEIGEDVCDILMNFSRKLENNDNCKTLVIELVDKLLKHSQTLKNPLGPLSDSIYHSQAEQVRFRAVPTTIDDARKDYIDEKTHFGQLYNMINVAAEEMNMSILFGDFQDGFKSLKKSTATCPDLSPSKKRKLDRRKSKLPLNDEQTEAVLSGEELGLAKAIFIDLIDCMEHQGLVKQDRRQSKQSILRRCVWL